MIDPYTLEPGMWLRCIDDEGDDGALRVGEFYQILNVYPHQYSNGAVAVICSKSTHWCLTRFELACARNFRGPLRGGTLCPSK